VNDSGEADVTPAKSANLPCFEDALAELESIVHQLEDGRLGLAEALARYEQGVGHLKHCYALLQAAERKIELLTGVKEDGTPITEPFRETDQQMGESAGRKRPRKGRSPRAEPLIRDDEGESADIDD
jgi:exodeoxyribonuclease VII small subunit